MGRKIEFVPVWGSNWYITEYLCTIRCMTVKGMLTDGRGWVTVAAHQVVSTLCKSVFIVFWPSFFITAPLQVWSFEPQGCLLPSFLLGLLSLSALYSGVTSGAVKIKVSHSSPRLHFSWSRLLDFLECQFQENFLCLPTLTLRYDHLPFPWAKRECLNAHSGINPLRCFREDKIQRAQVWFLLQKKTQFSGLHLCGFHSASSPGCLQHHPEWPPFFLTKLSLWAKYLVFTCSLPFNAGWANSSTAPVSQSTLDFRERPRLLALSLPALLPLRILSNHSLRKVVACIKRQLPLSWESLFSHSAGLLESSWYIWDCWAWGAKKVSQSSWDVMLLRHCPSLQKCPQ